MGMKPVEDGPAASQVTRERAQEAVDFLKHFAHVSRLLIVCSLIEAERSVGELETLLGIRQPTLSQQLGELREAGVIEGRREAKQVFYRIADDRAITLVSMLHGQFCQGEGTTPIRQTSIAVSPTPNPARTPQRRSASSEAARFARIERPRSSLQDNV